jgi:hypothetical protein
VGIVRSTTALREETTGVTEEKTGDNCVMFLSEQQLNDDNYGKSPFGLRISAILLAALGCVFALYVLLFGLLLGLSLIHRWQGHVPALDRRDSLLTLFMVVAVTAAFAYLCFRAAAALRNAQRWAAYVATGFGLLLLLLSADFFYDWFHPERQSPDEYFGIFIVPFCVALGLWWCIYLNLPRVRAYLS